MASAAINTLRSLYLIAVRGLEFVAPVLDLGIRLYVAWVFWRSGNAKIQSWSSTLELFKWEYDVPIFPPELAAYLATGIELVMPVLLVIGLASRPAALILFVLNWFAAISYPDISIGGMKDHYLWGLMLLITVFHGPGKLSVDYWLRQRWQS
jgi:putative oxidoreductase